MKRISYLLIALFFICACQKESVHSLDGSRWEWNSVELIFRDGFMSSNQMTGGTYAYKVKENKVLLDTDLAYLYNYQYGTFIISNELTLNDSRTTITAKGLDKEHGNAEIVFERVSE